MEDKETIEILKEQNKGLIHQIYEMERKKQNTYEYKLQQFLTDLFNKRINKTLYEGKTIDITIIDKDGRTIVEDMIRKFLLENDNSKIGELEAKVYTYEKIIANSNFAPIIEKKEEKK